MRAFKVHNLWPFPVYENEIPVKSKWKEFVLNLEYERTHVDNSDISKDRYVLNNILDLKDEIKSHVNNFTEKYLCVKNTADFYLQNSWSNIHKPGENSQIHSHQNSLLSAVYYPIYPKNSGGLRFHRNNLHQNLFHKSITLDYYEYNDLNSDQYVIDIQEGSIVVFPSLLMHDVLKNESNENRYSLAANYFVRGEFGKEEYTLKLK